MKRAAQYGAATKNGYEMLVHQAEKAWKIWNKK
jgi:shikimate dehydrogenase